MQGNWVYLMENNLLLTQETFTEYFLVPDTVFRTIGTGMKEIQSIGLVGENN